MARKKRVTAAEWIDLNPYPEQKSCEHCGTVALAITKWDKKIEQSCLCACHWARRYDRENKK
jgi:hypothetical protein